MRVERFERLLDDPEPRLGHDVGDSELPQPRRACVGDHRCTLASRELLRPCGRPRHSHAELGQVTAVVGLVPHRKEVALGNDLF